MQIITETIEFSTGGDADIIDITGGVQDKITGASVSDGVVHLCVVGSTGALTTCEFEPGLVKDLKEFYNKIIPPGSYHHDQAWGDGNGHSHLRASLTGPSLSLPFQKAQLILGTWQQVIFIDFDNRPRQRRVTVQIMGQ